METVLAAANDPAWEAAVSPCSPVPDGIRAQPPGSHQAPLLHGATVRVNARSLRRLIRDLLEIAAASGENAVSLVTRRPRRLDTLELLRASITFDRAAIEQVAGAADVDSDALGVIGQLSAIPLLHAAKKRLHEEVRETWMKGYCPICGAWPALAELRGLERNRRLRCGRCASDWMLPVLHCPFCDEVRHDHLGSLLLEGEEQTRRLDNCETCKGYVKTFSLLRPMDLRSLVMADLASVELDVAAQDRGYTRPDWPAFPLAITVERTTTLPSILGRWA